MLAALLVAQIVISPSSPPLSPAAAAAILARLDSPTNVRLVCADCDGPHSTVIRSRPNAGPYGTFAPFPALRPLNCCSSYVIHLPRGYGRQPHVPFTPAITIPSPRSYRGVPLTSTPLGRR